MRDNNVKQRSKIHLRLSHVSMSSANMSDSADITSLSINIAEVDLKVCFICGLTGDPINNKLKNLTCAILNNCINAIGIRRRSQSNRSRKSFDVSKIQLPKDLEEKGYHQQCFKQLTNLSGKRNFEVNDDTSQPNEDAQDSTR